METKNNNAMNEMLHDKKMLTGLFENASQAEKAYQLLIDKGYAINDISLIMSDETRNNYYPKPINEVEDESGAVDGAEKGTAIGGTIGITMGAIVGIALAIGSNIVVPGLGFLISGPLLTGIFGAGTGAITGGLIGGLMGVGFEEDRAHLYETRLKKRNILIGVHPKIGEKELIVTAWVAIGGTDIG